MARRVTGAEERELLKAAERLRRAEAAADEARAARDRLIADLLDSNARVSDLSEILGISDTGLRQARDRAHNR